MRRLGAILMIFGVNIAVASLVAAFWRASFECSIGMCEGNVLRQFAELLISGSGLVYWLVVIVGLLIFWRGKQIRIGH